MKYIAILFLLCPFVAFTQKQFSVTISLPSYIHKDKLDVSFYNGKEYKPVLINKNGNTITIKDVYYSIRAIVEIGYYDIDPLAPKGATFFIDDKPARIDFIEEDSSKNILGEIKLQNAVNAASLGFNQMKAHTLLERTNADNFYRENMDRMTTNDSVQLAFMKLADMVMAKQLEFIKNNGHLYYCFWKFGNGLINTNLMGIDSLLSYYSNAFPPEFKNSFEGKEMMKVLENRLAIERIKKEPDFEAKDITGQTISLSQFKNKYVLINFWASWCSPCIKKMPAFNKIINKVDPDKLEVIFITQDRDTVAFNNARKKYVMNGKHIFATKELIDNYKAWAIPRLYLVDGNGTIIYNSDELGDQDLSKLDNLIDKLR